MNFIKILSLASIIYMGGTVVNSNRSIQSKVIKNYDNESFPSKMCRTWYSYNKKEGLEKIAISKDRMDIFTNVIKVTHNLTNKYDYSNSNNIYLYFNHKDPNDSNWISIKGVKQNNDLYTSYRIDHSHDLTILTCSIGKNHIIINHFYTSEYLAKKLSK